mgnify:CR=1 FL=1
MEVKEVIEKGFADLKADQEQKAKSLKDEQEKALAERDKKIADLEAKHTADDKWKSEIQAQINTRAGGLVGKGKITKDAIPEHLRKHISYAEAAGRKDAVEVVAWGAWFQAHIQGMIDGRGGANPERWRKQKEQIEKGWGYEHMAYVELVVKAAMGEVAGGGANIIALPVEAELRRLIRDNTLIRPLANVITMTSLTHQIPTENANLTGFVIAEAGLVSDAYGANTTGYAQVGLTARKFGALVSVQNELLADNIVGLQDYLFTAMAEAIGILEDRAAVEGSAGGVAFTGIDVVTGVNSFSVAGTTSGGDVPTYPDLAKAVYLASHKATRMGAYWIMPPNVFRQVVGITDTNGQPVFQYANVPNAIPERILGYPVVIDSALSKTNAIKSGSLSIYFGPPGKIVFGDLAGMEFALDPYGLFTTYGTRLRLIKRTGIVIPVGTYFSIARGCSIT